MSVPQTDGCRCGHARAVHVHHRSGSDCGRCGPADCGRFRRAESPARHLFAGLRLPARRQQPLAPVVVLPVGRPPRVRRSA